MKPLNIWLVRHGESTSNVGEENPAFVGDRNISLTHFGKKQAFNVGAKLQDILTTESTRIYVSPFMRARETLQHMSEGAKSSEILTRAIEDPRLREMCYGYATDESFVQQQRVRPIHGWFYYRFLGGESPADVYDRCTTFIDSMWRNLNRREPGTLEIKNVVIVAHGGLNRIFVMRFLNLSVEQFETMSDIPNCGVVKISNDMDDLAALNPHFVSRSGNWYASGDLNFYNRKVKG